MDVALLVGWLAPLLPYLLKAGEQAAGEVGQRFGSGVWERAQQVWNRLWPQAQQRPAVTEAVQDVAAAPEDEDLRAQLRVQLRKMLADDPKLSQELGRLLSEADQRGEVRQVVASGERAVAAGGNISGTVTTGNTEHYH